REYYRDLFGRCSLLMQSIARCPVPVIARVHGTATAAGCQLVASCDLAVAAESARLAVSGINVGLFCATPSVALTRNVPLKNAFEMLVTGQFISARQAAERGLVNHAVPDADLDRAVQGLVDAILSKSPVAVRTGKAMVYRQLGLPLDQAYDHAAGIMAENMLAEDVGEGIDAFMQKRPPQWRGRRPRGGPSALLLSVRPRRLAGNSARDCRRSRPLRLLAAASGIGPGKASPAARPSAG